MKARAERIYVLMIKLNQLFYFIFSLLWFLRQIENGLSLLLSSNKITR